MQSLSLFQTIWNLSCRNSFLKKCFLLVLLPLEINISTYKWFLGFIKGIMHTLIVQGPPNTFLFFENALKKNYLFYLKVQSFRLIMENNFIQMAASAGHAVAYTILPIFKHIIDCVQLYFTNGFTNIVF